MISFCLAFDVFFCLRFYGLSMRECGYPLIHLIAKFVYGIIVWAWVTGGLHVNMNEEYDIKKLPI